jgi:hypothetical protein
MSDIYKYKSNKYNLKCLKLIKEYIGEGGTLTNIEQQNKLILLIKLINNIKKVITTISKENNILGDISIENIFDSNYDLKEDIKNYKLNEKQLIIQYFLKIKDNDKNKKYKKKDLIELLLNKKKLDLDEKLNNDIEERYKKLHYELYGHNNNFDVYKWLETTNEMKLLNKEELNEIFKDLNDSDEYDLEVYKQFIFKIAIIYDILKLWDYFLSKALNILIYIDIPISKKLIRKLVFLGKDIRNNLSILNISELLLIFDKIIVEILMIITTK